MGAFKPLLPFGNKTVIESCLNYLREGGIENIVVVLGHRAREIRDIIKDVTFAINPDPASEMGASIAAGIRAINDDAKCVLIALVDNPAIPATILSRLIDEWHNRHGKIVIPTWENRGGHPVLVDLSFKTELANLGEGGLRTFLKTHQSEVKRLAVESPFVARDMDTWDDYLALHKAAFGYQPPNV